MDSVNKLAKKHTAGSLIRFTSPTIIMLVFLSLYTMVDGVFISNFVGENALSALNIIFPATSIVLAISIMLASGASAVIARKMGEGELRLGKEFFTFIVILGVCIGIVIGTIGTVFARPIVRLLGATPALEQYAYDYLYLLMFFIPFAVLQYLFEHFFVTAGRPAIGLVSVIAAGCMNILLDYVFIVLCDMGIQGAALGTGISYCVPAITGLIYFSAARKGTLCFVKPKPYLKLLWQSCLNGSSEMVTNVSTAVTTILFNFQMLRLLGENGVAAITIFLYSQFLLTSIFFGFSSGVAPVFSYNYGENNRAQIKKIFRISIVFVCICAAVFFTLALVLAPYIVQVFAHRGSEVYEIAMSGFYIFAVCFLFAGVNIFSSALFTAFSNGAVSAIISILRTLIFIAACILLLPIALGVVGVWLAIPVAEALTLIFSIVFLFKYRKRYGY